MRLTKLQFKQQVERLVGRSGLRSSEVAGVLADLGRDLEHEAVDVAVLTRRCKTFAEVVSAYRRTGLSKVYATHRAMETHPGMYRQAYAKRR